jgi:hypothetical protein
MAKNSKHMSKYRGKFRLTGCQTGVVSVHYQLCRTVTWPVKMFKRRGSSGCKKLLWGSSMEERLGNINLDNIQNST